MSENIDIKSIHPELEPASAPSQFSFFGIGTRLYGQRDYSEQTRSYVSTLYFTVFFIPVIPISSYRIFQQGATRYVLGKSPLSVFQKKARLAVPAAVLVGGATLGAYGYLTSPGYIAGRQVSQAGSLVASGHQAQAAALYKTVFEGAPDEYKEQARTALQGLVSHEAMIAMGIRVVYRNNAFYYALMPGLWISAYSVFLGFGLVYPWYVMAKQLVIFGAHSNLRWDAVLYRHRWLHPLAWVVERTISTPATHFAHHALTQDDGIGHYKGNYGNLLFFWDVLFGTARITRRYPPRVGLRDDLDHGPERWQVQLLFPLLRSARERSALGRKAEIVG